MLIGSPLEWVTGSASTVEYSAEYLKFQKCDKVLRKALKKRLNSVEVTLGLSPEDTEEMQEIIAWVIPLLNRWKLDQIANRLSNILGDRPAKKCRLV